MNRTIFQMPDNLSPKARTTFSVTAVLLVVLVLFDIYSTYNYLTFKTSLLLLAMALSYAMTGVAYLGARMSLLGREYSAGWLLIAGSLVSLLLSNFLGGGLGIVYALTGIAVVSAIASFSLPQKQVNRAIIVSVIFGILGILIDLFWSSPRVNGPPIPQTFTFLMLALLMVAETYIISRQLHTYSLRAKLLIGGIVLVLISVATMGLIDYNNNRANLTDNAGNGLKSLADSQANAIANILTQEAQILQSFGLSKLIQDRVDVVNAAYESDANQEKLDLLDQQWRAADKAENNSDPLVAATLNNQVSSELREYSETFPENVEVFVTDRYGALVASTNRTSDYYQADEEWWQSAFNEGNGAVYIGQPEFDESSNTFGLIMAVPLYSHGTNRVSGVLRTTITIDEIIAILTAENSGGGSHVDLYLSNGLVLVSESDQGIQSVDPEFLSRLPALTQETVYEIFAYEGEASVVTAAQVTTENLYSKAGVQNLGWVLIVHQDEADSLAPVRLQARNSILIAISILIVGAFLAIFLAQTLTGPIVRLTAVTEEVAAGNIGIKARVETGDEIGTLARTFNSMTDQLGELIGSLEQRVADRTKALSTATEISRRLSTILNENQLATEVVEQIQKAYNYYHGQIYLIDESGKTLVLTGATGAGGRELLAKKHSLPIEKGLVGRAARTKTPVLVPDTSKDSSWLPNPLLPDTKAEIAIPILLGDQLLGVIDMQDDIVGDIFPEDIEYLTAISNQVAVALQNARSYARAQKKAEHEALLLSISRSIQQESTVESAMKVAIREVGRAIGNNTMIRLRPGNPGTQGNSHD